MNAYRLTDWLPGTKREVEMRGWDSVDVILFSGDAYVDHPSFGAAVIGRVLESEGLRVALVPQPDWRGDFRDFRKLGAPRLFFGVAPGAMDSMISHYTANKRLRSEDAYTPDRRPGMRPDYPCIVYAKILKTLYPDTPVVLGGIEASLRRLAHYDYWQDRLRPGILADSPADLLIYGMGEEPVRLLVRHLLAGAPFHRLQDLPQTVRLTGSVAPRPDDIELFSFEDCLKDRRKQARNFRIIEEESCKYRAARLLQPTGTQTVVVNPPCPPMSEAALDASFDLPYTRMPHPKYGNKVIPAFEMIRSSVNIHRGCFGGCAFCTISAHQGKFVVSRSRESILKEVRAITLMPGFKGNISDMGGPSANMYRMKGRDETRCRTCSKPSCLAPAICRNLHADHAPLLALYRDAEQVAGVRKICIGSGIRYDLLLHPYEEPSFCRSARQYMETVIRRHVSGRLKVAPEHTEEHVLKLMRKPSFRLFEAFNAHFARINRACGLNQQLIPYFISSHPGCTEIDMARLADRTGKLHFRLEQVQDFTPSPMTLATEMYYTGFHPYTLERIPCARSQAEKLAQRRFFFLYGEEEAHRKRKAVPSGKRTFFED
ncbi:MAG: YgiQ family radical SAM protein [Tannerella sp.]|nr:YgiQ family radical SAM protein [Tannerella sp.]